MSHRTHGPFACARRESLLAALPLSAVTLHCAAEAPAPAELQRGLAVTLVRRMAEDIITAPGTEANDEKKPKRKKARDKSEKKKRRSKHSE